MDNAFAQPQCVVVLGGTSDIARAIVDRLAAQRTRTVVLAGRDPKGLADAASAAQRAGATRTPTVTLDATDVAGAGACVNAAFDAAGAPVDLVIVAVGHLGNQLVDENDATAAGTSALVNFAWPVAALAEVRRRLVAQGSGRVVVFSSIGAIRVRRNTYLYGGAKAGLDRLCQGLADSLVGTGVSLQIVRPNFVRSKMTAGLPDAPMAATTDQVADAVCRGLSSGERVITIPPVLGYVFLILRHLPASLWRRVTANR